MNIPCSMIRMWRFELRISGRCSPHSPSGWLRRKVSAGKSGCRMVDLNTDTDISIAFYDTRRTVELHRGEALFSISHDTARPFLVEAGDARVLVTSTQFDVRRNEDRVMVAVQAGSVEFSAGPWWRHKRAPLTAGQVSVASPRDGLVSPYPDRIETITAWQRGRLVFRDVSLSDMAAELSRYLTRPIHRLLVIWAAVAAIWMMAALPAERWTSRSVVKSCQVGRFWPVTRSTIMKVRQVQIPIQTLATGTAHHVIFW